MDNLESRRANLRALSLENLRNSLGTLENEVLDPDEYIGRVQGIANSVVRSRLFDEGVMSEIEKCSEILKSRKDYQVAHDLFKLIDDNYKKLIAPK